jgi:menaquinone-9 beta-reductase
MRRANLLIIGGGPAGAAAAIRLAQAGASAHILERQSVTGDAICGGFLSWRTLETLNTLGIAAPVLGGHHVGEVLVSSGSRTAIAPLPGGAVGVSRQRLDTLLLDAAAAQGVAIDRGVAVREVVDDHLIHLTGGDVIAAQSIFLATGKHELRGLARPKSAAHNAAVGLRIRLHATPALQKLIGDRIELHLFDGGYGGFMIQEEGTANLCFAVRKDRLTAAGGDPKRLIAEIGLENPVLGDRLAHWSGGDTVDAIGAVPYGWRAQDTIPGVFRLGDQAAVIPSLAGEGNGIALASGVAAAKAWLSGTSAPVFQRDFAKRTARPVTTARLLWEAGERPAIAGMATAALGALPVMAGLLARLTRIPY